MKALLGTLAGTLLDLGRILDAASDACRTLLDLGRILDALWDAYRTRGTILGQVMSRIRPLWTVVGQNRVPALREGRHTT